MAISADINKMLSEYGGKINDLEYGNIDIIINKGEIIRVDIRHSIKPEKENK